MLGGLLFLFSDKWFVELTLMTMTVVNVIGHCGW